jgi:hypothetical protein
VKMSTQKLSLALAIFSACFLAGPRSLRAQDQPQAPGEDKPKPAGTAFPVPIVNPGDQETQPNNNLTPDPTPLAGVLSSTLGSQELVHSYWVPGIQWSGSTQSSSYNQTSNSGWVMNNYIIGNLSLLKAWSASQLAVNYSAGGFFSTDSAQGNGYYQQLALSQTYHRNRWLVQLLDQFSYLPESSFGFGGGSSLGIPGAGGSIGPVMPGIGNNYVPNQGIYTAVGPRYSNASVVQVTYTTSPRGSITVSGSHSLLDFVQSGNVNNDTTAGTIGYNYALTKLDTIGAFYSFSAFHFSGQPEAYGNHSVNLAYGRKITGRLALQLYGGPSFNTSRVTPTNKGETTHGVNTGANLSYGFERGGLSVGYTHGISGGSGVLTGSTGDQLNVGGNHSLGRIWSGQLTFGYSHNTPIANVPGTVSQTFNTWNVGGGVSRAVGRNANFSIAYNATIPDYGASGCSGAGCSSNQTHHYVTINFQWRTRPFVLP